MTITTKPKFVAVASLTMAMSTIAAALPINGVLTINLTNIRNGSELITKSINIVNTTGAATTGNSALIMAAIMNAMSAVPGITVFMGAGVMEFNFHYTSEAPFPGVGVLRNDGFYIATCNIMCPYQGMAEYAQAVAEEAASSEASSASEKAVGLIVAAGIGYAAAKASSPTEQRKK